MTHKLLLAVAAIALLSLPSITSAQAPTLGTAAGFVLFSSHGAVTSTGISNVTGNVGTNSGSSTGFGNVNGVIHDGDAASAQASADLLTAYHQLNSATPTFFPATLLGNGQVLVPGVYAISGAATLNGELTMNAQNNPNAVFIIQIQGSFSTAALSSVKLTNGALACNIYWKVEGLISMATGSTMRGTLIANNAAITLNVNDTLEGRALSTTGAVTIRGIQAYTPIGCGSAPVPGPAAPALASAECYAIFSASGAVSNSGITHVTGDVGSNTGPTTGYDTLLVTGTVHSIPDASTAQCATDLRTVYTYLNTLPNDIQLLYPAQFGNGLVLTPHTYLLNAATVLTGTVNLDAQGDSNAVFVIKINGALSTGTYSVVKLLNGAQAKNVFWKIEGAVTINNYSIFCGTIVCNNASLTAINTGVQIFGRAFTTTGSITSTAITAIMPPGCTAGAPQITTQPISQAACPGTSAAFSVVAHGTALTYQWRMGTVNLTNGGQISGATAAILTIDSVTATDAATNYNVVIQGATAPNEISSNVSLVVNALPRITAAPVAQTACLGSPARFSMAATGTGLTYQWKKGTQRLTDTGNISGAISDTLRIDPVTPADASTAYYVVVSGTCAPADSSARVALTLCPTGIGSVSEQPGTISIYPNPFHTSLTISVEHVASGSYEWRMYNMLGEVAIEKVLSNSDTTINTGHLPAGLYFYQVLRDGKSIQSGKVVSQQ